MLEKRQRQERSVLLSSSQQREGMATHERAMFPLRAKDMAFMNSVVLGTRAKIVIPRNFSSIPDPSRTTSTTSTRISVQESERGVRVSLNAGGDFWGK